jgi:streptogrisin C
VRRDPLLRATVAWLVAGASLVAAGTTAALAPPAAAAPPAEFGIGAAAPPGLIEAMRRDLGLSPDQARARLDRELAASQLEQELQQILASSYGGAWLTDDARALVVAVTDAGAAQTVREAGALPRLVAHGVAELDRVRSSLDRHASAAPAPVTSWYVDLASNSVVVRALPDGLDEAAAFVAASGADPSTVRVLPTTERPDLLQGLEFEVVGGERFNGPQGACSVGFSVVDGSNFSPGYITAGHCVTGVAQPTVTGHNGVVQGQAFPVAYPGSDYALVGLNSSWLVGQRITVRPNEILNVIGAQELVVGSSVCRSGFATGWQCGFIRNKGVSVRYPDGNTVNGLTETNACAAPGDSGGPFVGLAGGGEAIAVGLTSGGTGDCTSGGTSLYQPVVPVLQALQRQVVTRANAAPRLTGMDCGNIGAGRFSCRVTFQSQMNTNITWDRNGQPVSTWNDRSSVSGSCQVGRHVSIQVYVSSRSGTASSHAGFTCSNGSDV